MKKNNVPVYWLFTLLLMTSCGGGGGGSAIAPPASAAGTATLAWTAPAENVDDTLLTDLQGYKVYYGNTAGQYDHVVDVGKVTAWKFENLPAGNYFFVVRAYNQAGVESDLSNEQSKKIH